MRKHSTFVAALRTVMVSSPRMLITFLLGSTAFSCRASLDTHQIRITLRANKPIRSLCSELRMMHLLCQVNHPDCPDYHHTFGKSSKSGFIVPVGITRPSSSQP